MANNKSNSSSVMKKIIIISAIDNNRGIGNGNKLLYRISNDLIRFRSLTRFHTVIMGRKTFDSIGKPLPERTNIVITRNPSLKIDGCIMASSLQDALSQADGLVFIIGGESIYKEALSLADELMLTEINGVKEADAFFPEFKDSFILYSTEQFFDKDNQVYYKFNNYRRKQ